MNLPEDVLERIERDFPDFHIRKEGADWKAYHKSKGYEYQGLFNGNPLYLLKEFLSPIGGWRGLDGMSIDMTRDFIIQHLTACRRASMLRQEKDRQILPYKDFERMAQEAREEQKRQEAERASDALKQLATSAKYRYQPHIGLGGPRG